MATVPVLIAAALVLPATAHADKIAGANIVATSSNLDLETETSSNECATSIFQMTSISGNSAAFTGGILRGSGEEKYCEYPEIPGMYFTVTANAAEAIWIFHVEKEAQGTVTGLLEPLILTYTYYMEEGGGMFPIGVECTYGTISLPLEYAYGENPLMKIGQEAKWILSESVGEGCGLDGMLTGDFETTGLTISE